MHTISGETSLFSITVVSPAAFTIFDWIRSSDCWACKERYMVAYKYYNWQIYKGKKSDLLTHFVQD